MLLPGAHDTRLVSKQIETKCHKLHLILFYNFFSIALGMSKEKELYFGRRKFGCFFLKRLEIYGKLFGLQELEAPGLCIFRENM